MEIRNLKDYIIALCGEYALNLLGTNKEPLLKKIYGEDPDSNQVKAIISDAATFAVNAEEQLFYEFVQNAYDANADSLYFYANEDYLIVYNNGEPFYTDFNIFETDHLREGQLYNFLAKGKSLKRSDETKLGKYGQGSKLLYTLLTDVDESKSNEDLLIETLYDNKKGPILVSWNNQCQLDNLLQNQGNWTLANGDDYKNNILLAKIIMSYFPICPGTSDFFPNEEAIDAIKALDTLVDPKRNKHFLNKRGTAIIIPLGKGKYKKISSEENLSRVRTRLGIFAITTRAQNYNNGKTIEHINVFGEDIDIKQYMKQPIESVEVHTTIGNSKMSYHFTFNPVFAEKERNISNFYKGLPIIETRFQLGFIIDSQVFEVDSSRQRIVDKDKTKRQLIRAFSALVENLRTIHIEDREKFNNIYQSLIATQYPDNDEATYVKEAFQEVFTTFFEEFVLTTDGEYKKLDSVRCFDKNYLLPLAQIGITQYSWVEWSIYDALQRHNIVVKEIDFATLLTDADQDMLCEWIQSMAKKDYANWHTFFDKHKTSSVDDYKLFRSNKGNVYSYNELISDGLNVYYAIDEDISFGDCEHIEYKIAINRKQTYYDNLLAKIITNIDFFRKNDSTKEDAANILSWLSSKSPQHTNKIKSEVLLLSNWHEEYLAFEELFVERPKGTILFDNYCHKGYLPKKAKEWLLTPQENPKACWQWLVDHWENVQTQEDWGNNTHKYISDIKTIFSVVTKVLGQPPVDKLILYLDDDGKPTQEQMVVVDNISRLTKEEYNYLREKLSELALLPYEFCSDLLDAPFSIDKIDVNDIVDENLIVDKDLLRIIVKISDSYLSDFRTEETINDNYIITKLGIGKNYVDDVDKDLEDDLSQANFFKVPYNVIMLFSGETNDYSLATNKSMLEKAIETIGNPLKLLSFVRNNDSDVVSHFFENISKINIDSKISRDDNEWQVIKLAIDRSNNYHNFKPDLFEKIQYDGEPLPQNITEQYFPIGNNRYNVFVLDEDIKNENETIQFFFECLPSEKDANYFKEEFYKNKEKSVDVAELYKKLKGYYLNKDQLQFCIDYAISHNLGDEDSLEIEDTEDLIGVLDMIKSKNFKGFDKYFKIPNVNFKTQIYLRKDEKENLLLENEYLPKNLSTWLDNNPDAIFLFTRLTTNGTFIEARRALLNDTHFNNFKPFKGAENEFAVEAVIDWAIEKLSEELHKYFIYDSESYDTMLGIIEHLPKRYNYNVPLLKYTGEVDSNLRPTFKLERQQDDCAFLSNTDCRNQQFLKQLSENKNLRAIFQEKIVYFYKRDEFLLNQNLQDYPKWKVSSAVDLSKYKEFDNPTYKEWKKGEKSKGFSIFVTNNNVEINFNIKLGEAEIIFRNKVGDSQYGYDKELGVVVKYPNNEGLSVMQTIASHIEDMPFFQEPFIALQNLFIKELENPDSEIFNMGTAHISKEEAQNVINAISPEAALRVEQFNNIVEKMSEDELDKLSSLEKGVLDLLLKYKDKLSKLLKRIDDQEDEDTPIRPMIGCIGELIYEGYLNKKGVPNIYAAALGEGGYDFEVNHDNLNTYYVDVKTTLCSLKERVTAPFYLHPSQDMFLKNNTDCLYHIVRISLNDLGLHQEYLILRDKYEMNADPSKNRDLQKKCEEIATNYWKNTKLEEFESLLREYIIQRVNY